jgi:hypothetical protein
VQIITGSGNQTLQISENGKLLNAVAPNDNYHHAKELTLNNSVPMDLSLSKQSIKQTLLC